jgi:hypothetical protein|mmetsp:Transcript_21140/g.38409  ORF Transcript_21140/g.38409 Transcript_21140/m.38409 type:complete len:83 (-) Transcript_21140:129-377(-)
MDSVEQWYPAYIAEALYFVVLVLYKLVATSSNNKKSSVQPICCATNTTTTNACVYKEETITEDKHCKPALVFSESAMESFSE